MKKILTVSVLAMMAVSAANAEIASRAYVDAQDNTIDAKITTLNADASTSGSVANKIAAAIDQTYNAESTKAQSGTAVAQAIAGVASTAGTALQDVPAATGDANGLVSVVAKDGTNVAVTKALVAKTNLAPALVTEIEGKANTADLGALASKDSVAKTDLASALATEIDAKATTAALTAEETRAKAAEKANADAIAALDDTYATNEELTTGLAAKANTADLGTMASEAAANYYTKTAADAKFDTIEHVGTIPAGSSATTVIGYVDEKATAATAGMLTTSNYATTLDPVYINANEVTNEYAANGTAPVTGTAVNAAITTLGLGSMSQKSAADYTPTANLDSSTTATTGQVVTAISMENGALSQTTADPLSVTNYAKVAGNAADGKYALTATVTGGNITGYKWELISRSGEETVD